MIDKPEFDEKFIAQHIDNISEDMDQTKTEKISLMIATAIEQLDYYLEIKNLSNLEKVWLKKEADKIFEHDRKLLEAEKDESAHKTLKRFHSWKTSAYDRGYNELFVRFLDYYGVSPRDINPHDEKAMKVIITNLRHLREKAHKPFLE